MCGVLQQVMADPEAHYQLQLGLARGGNGSDGYSGTENASNHRAPGGGRARQRRSRSSVIGTKYEYVPSNVGTEDL